MLYPTFNTHTFSSVAGAVKRWWLSVSGKQTVSVFRRIYNALFPPKPDYLYDEVERWQKNFLKQHVLTRLQYYADAASGLAIALQVIDRERYDRTSGEVWGKYQTLLEENPGSFNL